jgi:ABC-type dipeptide/oligopeptide/nickel transport system permease component
VTAGLSFPAFIARRFALLALTLVLVPSLSFVMFTLIQGEHTAPLDVLGELASYLAAVFLQGEIGSEAFRGETFIRTRGALDVVMEGFLVDLYLVVAAIVLAVLIGLAAGALQATRPRSPEARAVGAGTAVALSAPVYWLGLVALLLFAPGIGSIAEVPFLSTVDGYRDPFADPVGFLHGLWLPALIVGTPLAAACTRMAASQLRGTLDEDFVRTAHAKGVGRQRVLWRHTLPAAAGPVVSLVGVQMNLILTNAALIETVFNIPGGFRYIEQALVNRDVDLVQALVVEATLFIVVANFLADAIHAWLDPRQRTSDT